MDTTEAQTLALDLMAKHDIFGWSFRWDRATARAGQTDHNKKVLSLSWKYVTLNDVADVRDTILHEIAHVLVPPIRVNGRWVHHGPAWKRTARAIGCTGERTTQADTGRVARPKRYEAICPGDGGHVAGRYARMPGRKMLQGGYCSAHGTAIKWIDTVTGQPLLDEPRRLLTMEEISAMTMTATRVNPVAAQKNPAPAPAWVAGSSDWDAMWGDA